MGNFREFLRRHETWFWIATAALAILLVLLLARRLVG
jgi:hypothetical protein